MSDTTLCEKIIFSVEGNERPSLRDWPGRMLGALLLPGGAVALLVYAAARGIHWYRSA